MSRFSKTQHRKSIFCHQAFRYMRFALAIALFANSATAATNTPVGRITELHGGWYEPNLQIFLDIPQVNPDNCSNPSGYIIPANLVANAQLTSLALTAYSLKHRVSLVVEGCIYETPRVIAVHIKE